MWGYRHSDQRIIVGGRKIEHPETGKQVSTANPDIVAIRKPVREKMINERPAHPHRRKKFVEYTDDADFVFENKEWVERWPSVTGYAKRFSDAIDVDAERARSLFLTAGDGQAMTYLKLEQEAEKYSDDSTPVEANYPFMADLIGTDGDTLADVQQLISGNAAVWNDKGPKINTRRRKGKKKIAEIVASAVTDGEKILAIDAEYAAFSADTNAIVEA